MWYGHSLIKLNKLLWFASPRRKIDLNKTVSSPPCHIFALEDTEPRLICVLVLFSLDHPDSCLSPLEIDHSLKHYNWDPARVNVLVYMLGGAMADSVVDQSAAAAYLLTSERLVLIHPHLLNPDFNGWTPLMHLLHYSTRHNTPFLFSTLQLLCSVNLDAQTTASLS